VDLARIIILLKFDLSALMGYTGAFFKSFFGTATGMAYSFTLLLGWASVPVILAYRRFRRMDI
jgi:Cu-processing system permease protein